MGRGISKSGQSMGEVISRFTALPSFKEMDGKTTQAVAQAAIRRVYEPNQIQMDASPEYARAFPTWFTLSPIAGIVREEMSLGG